MCIVAASLVRFIQASEGDVNVLNDGNNQTYKFTHKETGPR